MPGIHHPRAEGLEPHPRERCIESLCGMRPWRAENQQLYRDGYAAGYLAAIRTLQRHAEDALRVAAPLHEED